MNINKKIIFVLIMILFSIQFLNFSVTSLNTAVGLIDVDIESPIEHEETINISNQSKGTCVDYNFTNPELKVTSTQICARKNITNAVLKLRKINCSALPEPPHMVYTCLQFVPANLPETSIENAGISFNVDNSWTNEKSINIEKIRMHRYVSSWEELSTNKVEEFSEYVSFKSETPGFSYFAVTGQEKTVEEPPAEDETYGAPGAPAPSPAPAVPEEEEPAPEEIVEPEEPRKPLFDIGVLLLSKERRLDISVLLSITSSLLLILAALLIFFYKIFKLEKLR
ncbi:MAG: PGF-pre-PGF domain-containing protein [Candidatus Undinarchaeales archaeon]